MCCVDDEIEAAVEGEDGDDDSESRNEIYKQADAVAGEPAPWVHQHLDSGIKHGLCADLQTPMLP